MHHKRLQCEFSIKLSTAYIIKISFFIVTRKRFFILSTRFSLNWIQIIHSTQHIYTTKIYVVVGRYQTHSIARFWIWYSFFWNKSNVCIYILCVKIFTGCWCSSFLNIYLFFFSFVSSPFYLPPPIRIFFIYYIKLVKLHWPWWYIFISSWLCHFIYKRDVTLVIRKMFY